MLLVYISGYYRDALKPSGILLQNPLLLEYGIILHLDDYGYNPLSVPVGFGGDDMALAQSGDGQRMFTDFYKICTGRDYFQDVGI